MQIPTYNSLKPPFWSSNWQEGIELPQPCIYSGPPQGDFWLSPPSQAPHPTWIAGANFATYGETANCCAGELVGGRQGEVLRGSVRVHWGHVAKQHECDTSCTVTTSSLPPGDPSVVDQLMRRPNSLDEPTSQSPRVEERFLLTRFAVRMSF